MTTTNFLGPLLSAEEVMADSVKGRLVEFCHIKKRVLPEEFVFWRSKIAEGCNNMCILRHSKIMDHIEVKIEDVVREVKLRLSKALKN